MMVDWILGGELSADVTRLTTWVEMTLDRWTRIAYVDEVMEIKKLVVGILLCGDAPLFENEVMMCYVADSCVMSLLGKVNALE